VNAQAADAARPARVAQREESRSSEREREVLRRILAILIPLACPECGGAGIGGGGADSVGRASRKSLALFDLVCSPSCSPPTPSCSPPTLSSTGGEALKGTLALLLMLRDTLLCIPSVGHVEGQGGGGGVGKDGGGERKWRERQLKEIFGYRLKHLRFLPFAHDAPKCDSDGPEATLASEHATSDSHTHGTGVAAKSAEFWRVLAQSAGAAGQSGSASACKGKGGMAVDARLQGRGELCDASIAQECAALWMQVCGVEECFEWVRARAPRGCGLDCALAALFLRRAMALGLSTHALSLSRSLALSCSCSLAHSRSLLRAVFVSLSVFLAGAPARWLSLPPTPTLLLSLARPHTPLSFILSHTHTHTPALCLTRTRRRPLSGTHAQIHTHTPVLALNIVVPLPLIIMVCMAGRGVVVQRYGGSLCQQRNRSETSLTT